MVGAVWRPSAPLPHRYKRYGCRREAMAEASGLGKKHDQTNPLLTITPPLTLTLTLTLTPPLTPTLPLNRTRRPSARSTASPSAPC